METKINTIELGADDFITKPFDVGELRARINRILMRKKNDISLNPLTQLPGSPTIQDETLKRTNSSEDFGFAYIDVDNFKHYNDTNGHQLGDEVLKGAARILKDGVRRSDMAARYGGEEFVIVLPGTPKKMAENIAEKLRKTLEEEKFVNQEKQPKGTLTASFGVSSFPENGGTPEIVLKGAAHCLYLAKVQGRNSVVGADGIIEL